MSIKDWIVRKFLVGYLNEWLKKLPFDGWKTVLGVLLIVLGELMKAMPEYSPYFQLVIEVVNQLPVDVITDMGIVALITGVLHKLLKLFERRV